jgi:chaperone required for assembly of F1-ATPase
MRDLFEHIFVNQPLEPSEAARRGMRPHRRRRFYQQVGVEQRDGEFHVVVDGRPVRTPARHALAAPALALAEILAAEWQQQREVIDPATMPLTRLANSIIDGVATAPAPVAAEVEKYLASDLVLYRAEAPEGLVARQTQAWDPVLSWASADLGAHFVPARRLLYVAQSPQALAAAGTAIPTHPWPLGALHAVTTLTGSALIALALAHRALSLDEAWTAAHVDEDWNMERWGQDALALERRKCRFTEMRAAALVLENA